MCSVSIQKLSSVDSLRPHGPQPTSLLCPWNFQGKNTGVVAISFSRRSSDPGIGSCLLIGRRIFTTVLSDLLLCVVQLLSFIRLFATPWTAEHQAPLSSIISQSLLKFISIESVMLSNYLILCCPLLLLPLTFPSTRVFSNESILASSYQSTGASASA